MAAGVRILAKRPREILREATIGIAGLACVCLLFIGAMFLISGVNEFRTRGQIQRAVESVVRRSSQVVVASGSKFERAHITDSYELLGYDGSSPGMIVRFSSGYEYSISVSKRDGKEYVHLWPVEDAREPKSSKPHN